MDTLHLKIKDKEVYDHLIWFLKRFDETELEVLEGDEGLAVIQNELQEELDDLDSGNSELVDIEVFDEELERMISKNERQNL